MSHYYNEWEPYAAAWLRNLISAGHLPAGDVDERSIADVAPSDLIGYTQCHFFAGIGGWALAARMAGWPDDRPLWTGSCPCQPFSVAGKGEGQADTRHLWPEQFRLIRACRPDVWMGEQVAAAVGKSWFDGVCADLESIGYTCGSAVVPACAVDAPHRRDRLWIVADSSARLAQRECDPGILREMGSASEGEDVADDVGVVADAGVGRRSGANEGQVQQSWRTQIVGSDASDVAYTRRGSFWGGDGHTGHAGSTSDLQSAAQFERVRSDDREHGGAQWIIGHDGKARRVKSGIRLLAHGVPARVGKLRALGNAIVPQVAAEVIRAWMECAA